VPYYNLSCNNCFTLFNRYFDIDKIIDNRRMVNIPTKEHQRDIRLKHHTISIIRTSRQAIKYCLNKTTTIVTTTSYFSRKYRKAIEIDTETFR